MKLCLFVGMTGKERKKIDKATSNEKPELASYRYEVHTGTPRVKASAKTGRQVDTLPMVASIHPYTFSVGLGWVSWEGPI